MFGIGMPELIIILVIALIVIGPSKLPELAKALGKGMAEFRKATSEIRDSLDLDEELREAKEDLIDSVSGLDQPRDMEPPKSPEEERAKNEDVYEMEKNHEKPEDDPQEGEEKLNNIAGAKEKKGDDE